MNFSCFRYECAQTVSCSFVYPAKASDVQSKVFTSGLLVGVGFPLTVEGFKDALRNMRRNDKSQRASGKPERRPITAPYE